MTHTNDSIVVDFNPEKQAAFDKRLSQEISAMMSAKINALNRPSGNSSGQSFVLVKKYAKLLKGTKYNEVWEQHTPNYWAKQMEEIQLSARAKVEAEFKNWSPPCDADELGSSSGIVLQ